MSMPAHLTLCNFSMQGSRGALWRLLEWRNRRTNCVCRTWRIVVGLRRELGSGEAQVGTVESTGADTVRLLGSRLHILVASSSENLLLFIKCCRLGEGDTAAWGLGSPQNQQRQGAPTTQPLLKGEQHQS